MEIGTETGSIDHGHGDHEPESDSSDDAIDLFPPEMWQSIYKFLPFPDLLVCREVNKRWKSVATESVQKRCAPLSFSRADIPKNQRSTAIQSFCQLIRAANEQGTLGEFPLTEFEMDLNSEFYWIKVNGSTLISQFLEAVSPFVKRINFGFFEHPHFIELQLPNICFGLPQHLTFPNLSKIILRVYQDQNDGSVLSFIKEIIERCPDIKEIHPHLLFDNIRRNGGIRRWIVETGIEEKASFVASFKMTAPKTETDLEYLSKLGIKLKYLSLNLFQHNGNTEIFNAFLKSQSDILISLHLILGNRNNCCQYFRELPCLTHLKNLSVFFLANFFDHPKKEEDKFPTLLYEKQLPALKTLDLRIARLQFAASYFMASHMAPSQSLQELILPQRGIDDAGEVIRQAARLFPNLKKLQVFHETAGPYMRDIYENLSGIEELCITISDREGVDDFITGLPKRLLHKMGAELPPSRHLSKAVAVLERGTTKTLASLENLKTLMIHRYYTAEAEYVGGVDFTEVSGVVLKQMKNLQRIDFGIRKYGPNVSVALKQDLETQGIKLNCRTPRYIRLRTDFIASLTDDELLATDSDSD